VADSPTDQSKPGFRVIMFADFICPYCYIGQERMEQLARDYDVRPQWRPYWLHPETPPEGAPFPQGADRERARTTLEWLQEMAPEKAARIRFPDKLQCSFFAFEAVEFAQEQGSALPFTSAVYDALWVEGKDIARMSTLQDAAAKVGLDADEMGCALRERRYMEQTFKAVEASKKAGVSNTPTYILGRTAIKGWHYYEVFQTVMEKQGMLPKAAGGGSD
jgi:predicted DsbA family dithiol-disulfide isomerase